MNNTSPYQECVDKSKPVDLWNIVIIHIIGINRNIYIYYFHHSNLLSIERGKILHIENFKNLNFAASKINYLNYNNNIYNH
jgi:hypothetical protein